MGFSMMFYIQSALYGFFPKEIELQHVARLVESDHS